MEQFYTLLTDIGKAKIANATALQKKLELSKIVLGDSNGSYYEPTESQTKLKNKVWEGEISNKSIDKDNPNWIIVQTIIPSQIGGFTIREAGILDSEGDLVVVCKYPETYKPKIEDGSTKDITINLILEVSNVDNVTLKVDPTISLATKKDIENAQRDLEQNIKDIELKAKDIKTEDGKTVESQLADKATQISDINLKNEEQQKDIDKMMGRLTFMTCKRAGYKEGYWTTVTWYRKNGTLYAKSELLGEIVNEFVPERIAFRFYDNTGNTVIETYFFDLTFDKETGDLIEMRLE